MVFSHGSGSNEERRSESRRDSASPQGIPPELSNLINQVLAIERIGPLRRGISCYARPTYAVGSRQMRRTCTMILKDGKLICRGAGDSHLPRSMRARSPHVFSPSAVPTANGREAKLREPTGTAHDLGNSAVALELDKSSSRHRADWTAPAGEFRATHDQLTQLDRGRCKAPAPYCFYKRRQTCLPGCR